MPSPRRTLTTGDIEALVRDRSVCAHAGQPRVGLELEWLTLFVNAPDQRVAPADLTPIVDAVTPLPRGGRVTIEPGGQIEISTRPFDDPDTAIAALRVDARALHNALERAGIVAVARGRDHTRTPERVVDAPRYRAMETYFDVDGPEGRTMMCNSASLQINIDSDGSPSESWRAAQIVAPLLGELFSEPTPNRLDLWRAMDESRTAAVGDGEPCDAWARYALDARVMFVRTHSDHCEPMLDGMTMRDWATDGHALGWPDETDVYEHLTTLFPPVRPRGWLEIRTIDALPEDRWTEAVTMASTLLRDGTPRRTVLDAGSSLEANELVAVASCR
jgi:glutamate--cysteine ligase